MVVSPAKEKYPQDSGKRKEKKKKAYGWNNVLREWINEALTHENQSPKKASR